MRLNQAALTKEFPALNARFGGKKLVYLDSACTALKMRSAAAAQQASLLGGGVCAGRRSAHLPAVKAEEAFFMARREVAAFMGAPSPEELIFTAGTTDAFNIFINSFPFTAARNEVIISPLEHNAVFLPLLNLAEAGVIKLRVLALKNWAPDARDYGRFLGRRTALVCLNRASNIFGGVTDTAAFTGPARAAGAKVFFDDAQYLPTHKGGAAAAGADACAFSGHKIGAPFGTGALYVERSLMARLRHARPGGGTVRGVSLRGGKFRADYLDNYQGFEAGVQNYSGAAALANAAGLLTKAGPERTRRRMAELVAYGLKRLSGLKLLKPAGSAARLTEGSIIPLIPAASGFSCQDFSLFLNQGLKGEVIALRTGRHCADLAALSSGIREVIRLSFFIYSTENDIDAFAAAAEKYSAALGAASK